MKSRLENRTLAEFAYDRGDVVVDNAPEIFAIEGTNHCNIKCIMCPRGEPDIMKRKVGHMRSNTFDNVIENAHFFSNVCWLHWFGEPLMNPRIFDQIKLAKSKIPNVGISTNATLLNTQAQRNLIDCGLDTLMIAVDGVTKDVYESVRKSARFSFERVAANAEQFLALRKSLGVTTPRVTLSIIAMDVTAPDLEPFRTHWMECGADEVLFKPFTNWGGQNPDVFDDLQVTDIRNSLKELRTYPCQLLWTNLVVAWNGDVVPCCLDYDAKSVMGNINQQSLDEIWNGSRYIELRRAELEGRNNSSLCANCSQAPGRPRNEKAVSPNVRS